ncbi:UNVERIFIED_CONTAM: hypothetical protein FKN15_020783 [Acipenser sinensis]
MESPRAVFRTSESEPASHGEQHIGQFYTIPPSQASHREQHIGQFYTIPPSQIKTFNEACLMVRKPALELIGYLKKANPAHPSVRYIKTFNEACLMVRKPALELIGYLKKANPAHPSVRYVLYGERGTGKSLSLCHALHHCSLQDWLILHVPDAHLWVKNCKELMASSYHRARFDQPIEASVWLKNFRVTNERFLKQIKTSQKYVWSKREFTDEGRPLGEIVDQGVTRVKNASDAVGVVLKELKTQARPGSYRLVVGVDGVNALWGRTTLRKEDRSLRKDSYSILVIVVGYLHYGWRKDSYCTAASPSPGFTTSLISPSVSCMSRSVSRMSPSVSRMSPSVSCKSPSVSCMSPSVSRLPP